MIPFAGNDTATVLTEAMKVAEFNHRILANNIANVDTPHFTPAHLDFQKTLKAAIEGRGGIALRTSRPRHLDFTEHHVQFEGLAFLSKNDYNKVDLDEEMVSLSQNTGKYTTYARLLAKRFDMTKSMLSMLGR